MQCLHPSCPKGHGASDWQAVVDHPDLQARLADRTALLQALPPFGNSFGTPLPQPTSNGALLGRLLCLCPCLYAQLPVRVTARAVVHLCEATLRAPITSQNICQAFSVQHPSNPQFLHPPLEPGAKGGDIMEEFCSEVLTNEQIPPMGLDPAGWPIWESPAHVSLNSGKFARMKLYGDILIPAAPTNILISVKSEATRERLLLSGNRFESIGFGFFNDAAEFWTQDRMNLFKRMGFTAVYMPRDTVNSIFAHLQQTNTAQYAININGKQLYRPIEDFGADMRAVAGRVTLDL